MRARYSLRRLMPAVLIVFGVAACADPAPAATPSAAAPTAESQPMPARVYSAPALESTACRFPVPAGEAVDCADLSVPEDYSAPAVSDIPALLLSGAFDPSTPPAWARLAAATLSNGYVLEFPAEAHDVMTASSCARDVAYSFIQDPVKPTASCLDQLAGPAFETP